MMMSGPGINGVAVHCLELCKYLVARGHKVLLLHRPGAWISLQPGLEGIALLPTSFSRTPRELIRTAQLVEAFGADVAHTHMSSAHSYGAIARLFSEIPVVATAHVAFFQLHWRLNHAVIAVSQEVADFHRHYNRVAARALRVIPGFIDTARFSPATASERQAARQRLGLPKDAFVVGSVGNLSYYKQPADLVRALAKIVTRHPDARLVLIGGEYGAGDAVRETARALGLTDNVVLTGHRSDVAELLAAFDVFALASSREAGPIAVLEAMTRRIPVVATRTGMLPDFVPHGEAGYIVEIGDTETLGDHLERLAEDPALAARLGAAAREHVERHFSLDAIAPQIEAVLAETAARRNRPPLGAIKRLLVGTAS
jgi:glycosyltransferase involved in cell wall biosynthesis